MAAVSVTAGRVIILSWAPNDSAWSTSDSAGNHSRVTAKMSSRNIPITKSGTAQPRISNVDRPAAKARSR